MAKYFNGNAKIKMEVTNRSEITIFLNFKNFNQFIINYKGVNFS